MTLKYIVYIISICKVIYGLKYLLLNLMIWFGYLEYRSGKEEKDLCRLLCDFYVYVKV